MASNSHPITPAGAAKLRQELERLWRVERPEVTRKVAAAAALGDRSENAEYIYGKRQLRDIDRRVRFLRRRLAAIRVVDRLPNDCARIFFGAWVHLEDEAGVARRYRIVGSDEFDVRPEYISIDAPLARALLGKVAGDEVSVPLPSGKAAYYVQAVNYEDA